MPTHKMIAIRRVREELRRVERRPILRVAGLYVLFSTLWILFSDRFFATLAFNEEQLTLFQNYKGIVFVVLSGLLIYWLGSREMKKREEQWMDYDQQLTGLTESLIAKTRELEQAYDATIAGWARALEMHNRDVQEHSQRVTTLSLELGRSMGLDEDTLKQLKRGALLHDIGKISIPDAILQKEGPLTQQERSLIEEHPILGYDLLAPIEFLQPALDVPRYHHEKWDGGGYPHHLHGDQIPRLARIFAVVDVFDAMTTDRAYREALHIDDALEYIRAESGKSFDPEVVEAFLRLVQKRSPR
jgi:putative nucleotidyltransferase with HDIG domain